MADVLAAVIVAQLEAGGDVPGERTEALAHRLPDRLERLEAIGAATGVDADALGRAVVDGDEHRGLAFASRDRGQVGAPHQVDPLGGDRAVVGLRAPWPAGALVGQQAVRPHEPQDTAAAGADAGEAQPGPQLAVALAVERAVRQELSDRRCQALVRYGAARPGPLALAGRQGTSVAVDGSPRHAPDARDPLQAVDSARRRRDLPAHRLGLRRAKGRAVSKRSIAASRSSVVIVSSPTLACSRPIAASRASAGRVFSDAPPPARNRSRQPLSSAAGAPRPRETSSRSSPRSRRSTASCLRQADMRRRGSGAGPSPPAWRARSAGPTPTPTVSSISTSLQSPTCKAVSQRTVGRGPRLIRREPLGLVLVLAPWNFPYLTVVNAIIPALAAGNTVLIKHSAQTPLVAE